MYCPFCGNKQEVLMKHCPFCGRNICLLQTVSSVTVSKSTVDLPTTADACGAPASSLQQFMKFRELKQQERKGFSKSKCKTQTRTVKINIGVMTKRKDGIKPSRGKTLPLHVEPHWSAEQLLTSALKKLKDFNQDMKDGQYVLLYPDGKQITNIPGTDQPFTVGHYKEEVGKAYNRIILYVCTLEDFSESYEEDIEEDNEVIVRMPSNVSPLSDTLIWTNPETSTPDSSPSTSQSSNKQGAASPKWMIDAATSNFYHKYTDIYAPVIIDSSSSESEVEQPMEEDMTEVTASDVIRNLAMKINKSSFNRFNINRANVWNGALRGFKRSTFDPNNRISVKFSDDAGLQEEGLDSGGPTREFLTLLINSIQTRPIFEGRHNARYLAFNTKAAEDNEYFHVGKMIAVSIIHGGPGPRCLSSNLFWYLVGKTFQAPVEDILDEQVRSALLEIKSATTLRELHDLQDKHSSMLQIAGCCQVLKTLEDKSKIIDDYTQWYFIYRNHLSIQRFKEGLSTLNFLCAIEQHPYVFQPFMCHEKAHLTADVLDELFRVNHSPSGSTKREEEATVLTYWRDYLIFLEEKEASLALEDILMFATGLREIPPAGIHPTPQLVFQRSCRFPMANVCSNTIQIPVVSTYEEFQKAMDYGVQNSPGFGLF